MTSAEKNSSHLQWQQWASSDLMLGTLVALLSILTAFAAYQASISTANASVHRVEGQRILSESSAAFLSANQEIILDYTLYDNFIVNEGKNEFASEYYESNFSQALTNSLERPNGPFDDEYYQEMLKPAESLYDQSVEKFAMGQKLGDRANQVQLVMLIFAVGLSLVAWSSLLDEGARLRAAFAVFSTISLVSGLLYFATL